MLHHPDDGPVAKVSADEAAAVRAMDGGASLPDLQDGLREVRGAFAFQDLCLLLYRLWEQDLLDDGARIHAALFPDQGTRQKTRARAWRLVRGLAVVRHRSRELGAALGPLRGLGGALGSGAMLAAQIALSLVPLALLLLGVFEPPEPLFNHRGSWVTGILIAYAGAALIMSLRGLVRAALLAATEPGLTAAGLTVQLGVVYFDVDEREAHYLPLESQLRFAVAGLAAIGSAAGLCTIGAVVGGPTWLAIWAVVAFLLGIVDLCPFILSDGARLIDVLASIDRQSLRLGGYFGRRMLRDVTVARDDVGGAVPVIASLWIAWFFAGLEVFRIFFLRNVLALMAAIVSSDDRALTVVGGVFVGYVLAVALAMLAVIAFVLISLVVQALSPDRATRPVDEVAWTALDEAEQAQAASIIGALPIAASLDEALATALFARMVEATFAAGAWVQRAGQRRGRFFCILDGRVELLQPGVDGRPERVAVLGPGDSFGEDTLLDHAPGHHARALERCRLIALDGAAFNSVVRSSASGGAETRAILEVAEQLDGVPELAGLGPDGRLELATKATERHFDDGADIVCEGDRPDNLYVIRQGRCSVRRRAELVAELGAGDTFGEIGLLLDQRRIATVSAAGAVDVIEIPGTALTDALSRSFHVGLAFERLAAARLEG